MIKMRLALIIGTRPQIIKIAPLVKDLKKENIDFVLINTGQHYDFEMDGIFFKELDIECDHNLGIGSDNHNVQISKIITELENILNKEEIESCFVIGDTNSTLGASLCSKNMELNLVHIESGLRSYDMTMPEERNRIITDHISDFLLTPTKNASDNLTKENISSKRIIHTGDLIFDVLTKYHHDTDIINRYNLDEFIFMTLHRPSNVDNRNRLSDIFSNLPKYDNIFFPCHPRTRKDIINFRIKVPENVILTDPVGYFDSITLIKNSKAVITDSGGVQREAFILRKKCLVLRNTTEWPETLHYDSALIEPTEISEELKNNTKPYNYNPELVFIPNSSENIINFIKERIIN